MEIIRYYSYYQIISVMLAVVLSTVSVASIVYYYFRKNSTIFLIIISLISIYSALAVFQGITTNISIYTHIEPLKIALLITILAILGIENIKYNAFFFITICAVLVALFFISNLYFIKSITFNSISYNRYYKIVLISVFILFYLNITINFIYKVKNKIYFNIKLYLIINIFLVLVPLIIYVILIIKEYSHLNIIELILLIMILVYTIIKYYLRSGDTLLGKAFNDISDISSNYIFVVDSEYKCIYKNKAVKESNYIKDINSIDLEHLERIFISNATSEKDLWDNTYIAVDDTYYSPNISVLRKNNKIIGYVITFTTITDLISISLELDSKRKLSVKKNKHLENYSKVVYGLEKEKEVTLLLEGIIKRRDLQLKQLSNMLMNLIDKVDDSNFEDLVDDAIAASSSILKSVRDTVTGYRQYYGG